MERRKTRRLWVVLVVMLLARCSAFGGDSSPPLVTPRPTPLLTPVYATQPLTTEISTSVVELAILSSGTSGPIAALAFTSDGYELLAVQGMDGDLQRWRIEDGVLLQTLDVGPIGLAAVAFDRQARLVATGAGKTDLAIKAGYAADFAGARVWDTRSGELVLDTGEDSIIPVTDVALSSDGRWLAAVSDSGIGFYEVDTGASPFGIAREVDESPRVPQPSITAATFGPVGNWAAYADDIGWVLIEEWKSGVPGHHQNVAIERGGRKITPLPLALAIDPSRHRMAMVTAEFLVVWNLQAKLNKMLIKETQPSSPLSGLVFSPDGNLLAVGTAGGWQLWSVKDKELLIESDEPTYAVAFNPDGRLFAWGDTDGVVHLWGVPAP
jgi:WD40 repeat protein